MSVLVAGFIQFFTIFGKIFEFCVEATCILSAIDFRSPTNEHAMSRTKRVKKNFHCVCVETVILYEIENKRVRVDP